MEKPGRGRYVAVGEAWALWGSWVRRIVNIRVDKRNKFYITLPI